MRKSQAEKNIRRIEEKVEVEMLSKDLGQDRESQMNNCRNVSEGILEI